MPKLFIISLAGIVMVLALVLLLIVRRIENRSIYTPINIRKPVNARKLAGKSAVRKPKIVKKLFDNPIIGRYLKWVRSQLFLAGTTGVDNLGIRSIVLGFGSIFASIFIFAVLVKLYHSNLYITTAIGFGCIYLNKIIILSFTKGSDTKLLENLIDYIGDIKHFYHATGMVDEAIKSANLKTYSEMLNQGTIIHKVLTGANSEELLKEYYERCHNKFLKILAGFSHLVKEYGDKKVDGISLYIKNLNYISEEIQIEIIKKNQLSYWLKGLNLIVLLPLFLPPLIESFVKSSFPMVSSFYSSSNAFYIKCIIFLIVAVCYAFILQIQKTEYRIKPRTKNTWDFFLSRVALAKFILNWIMPNRSSTNYRKIKLFLEDAGAGITVEGLYIRRIMYGMICFLITIGVFWAGKNVNIEMILNDVAYGIKNANYMQMLGKLSTDDVKQQSRIREFDRSVINGLREKSYYNGAEEAEVTAAVTEEISRRKYPIEMAETAVRRVYAKMDALSNENVRISEIIIALITSAAASFFPVFILLFRKSLRKVDMEDEVFQFHTIVILLMHHDNVDVKVVLEWMKEFANIFKVPVEMCLANFHNQDAALKKLKEDVKFKPFEKLVENLEMANRDITVRAAFDSLELERNFYKENRKETNKQQVSKKIEFGQMIGFIPVHTVILLYLALPLIVSSYTAFNSIKTQLM